MPRLSTWLRQLFGCPADPIHNLTHLQLAELELRIVPSALPPPVMIGLPSTEYETIVPEATDETTALPQPIPIVGGIGSDEMTVLTLNALGRIATATDRNGSVHSYSYDALGRLVSDAVISLGTDVDGSVRRIEIAYDDQGNAALFTSFDAASGGNIVNQVLREFDKQGRLVTEFQAHAGAVDPLTTAKVGYFYSGTVAGAIHNEPIAIAYPNGRLVEFNNEEKPPATVTGSLVETVPGTFGSTPLPSDTATDIGPIGDAGEYDPNGNLTGDDTGRQFIYDAWNRLVAVRDHLGDMIASYQYDGLGRRITETTGDVTRVFYFSDRWQVLEERVNGRVLVQYIWSRVDGNALILRDRDTDGDGILDERLWVVQDENHNVIALVDDAGNVVEQYTYDEFGNATVYDADGNVRADGSGYDWEYLFQGQRFNPATDLYDSPRPSDTAILPAWLQTDPVDFFSEDENSNRLVEKNETDNLDSADSQRRGDQRQTDQGSDQLSDGPISIALPADSGSLWDPSIQNLIDETGQPLQPQSAIGLQSDQLTAPQLVTPLQTHIDRPNQLHFPNPEMLDESSEFWDLVVGTVSIFCKPVDWALSIIELVQHPVEVTSWLEYIDPLRPLWKHPKWFPPAHGGTEEMADALPASDPRGERVGPSSTRLGRARGTNLGS
jgi:YD repeat-containing protein